MIEILISVLVLFFIPVPWLISALHVLIASKKWRSASVRISLTVVAWIIWIAWAYWLYFNYPLLFENQFSHILAMIAGGLALAAAAAIEITTYMALGLKRVYGSSEFNPSKEDKMVTKGIYQYARHPRYLEHPLWLLGAGLLFGYPYIIALSVYLFLSFALVAKLEEKELIQRYGQEYLDYKKKVPAYFIF